MREFVVVAFLFLFSNSAALRNLQQQNKENKIILQTPLSPMLIYPLKPSLPTMSFKGSFKTEPEKIPQLTEPKPSNAAQQNRGPGIRLDQDKFFKVITQKYEQIKQKRQPRKDLPFYCSMYRDQSQIPKYDGTTRQKLVATNYGFNMYVDARDLTVSAVIGSGGTWEPGYIQLFSRLVKEGDNILNLGSQSGLEALILGKIVGSKGKVFVFQPYSFSNFLVTKNFQMNNMSSYTKIYKVGASDQKQTGIIKVSYWNTGGSQIHKPKSKPPTPINSTSSSLADSNKSFAQNKTKSNPFQIQFFDYTSDQTQQIEVDLVDNLLPEDFILNFALLDVEKMEIKALRGMRKIIDRSPDLIIMTQWQYGSNLTNDRNITIQFLLWMIGKKYRIYTYEIGDINECTLGRFKQWTKQIQQLLTINFIDIFFFPSHIALPTN